MKDRQARAIRIIAIVLVVALGALYFTLNPSGLTPSGNSSSQASTSSSERSSNSVLSTTSGTRPVGTVEAVTVYHIIDGDTLYVHHADGTNDKVRLVGMNCPESVAEDTSRNTQEGVEASNHTKALVRENQTIWLSRDTSDTDQYGRLLRYVWLEEPSAAPDETEVRQKMLNAIIVADGYAQAKRYKPDTAYYSLFKKLQEEATDAGRGVSYSWS